MLAGMSWTSLISCIILFVSRYTITAYCAISFRKNKSLVSVKLSFFKFLSVHTGRGIFLTASTQRPQKDNVSNQREHLILLLANAESRVGTLSEETALAHNAKVRSKSFGPQVPILYSLYIRL